jgi:hypothetical protein
VALQRAARNLARQGKIDLGYDQGKIVILKPSNCSQGWAPAREDRERETERIGDGDATDQEVEDWLYEGGGL